LADPASVTIRDVSGPVLPELAAALSAIEPLTPRLQTATVALPGSQAEWDARVRVGRHASELAIAALAGGLDHLEAWRQLVVGAGVLPPLAYVTLIRAGLEGAVVARWLLEPGLARDERRSRGLGAQRADYEERRKFEEQRGMGRPPRGKRATERISDLEKVAKRLGLTIRRPPDRTRLFELYAIPAARPLTRPTLGAELYRVLSGSPHGRQWTMPGTARHEMVEGFPPGQRIMRLTINEEVAATATMLAVAAMSAAIADLEAYTLAPRNR
jgi:hypothetical protein